MRRLTILTALFFSLAFSVDAAIMAVVTEVFADNSCRTYGWYPAENCHGPATVWCDPARSTCVAATAPWSIPPCGERTPAEGEETIEP